MTDHKSIAKLLLHIKAVKINPNSPFLWSSGMRSPIYCDNRLLLAYPRIRNVVKSALVEKSKAFDSYEVIAGVATAGIPHGTLMADLENKPFIYVRGKAKSHGRQNQIEGEAPKGSSVLVVEDLISSGGSSLDAVRALQAADYKISGVIAIFSYDLSIAKVNFTKANVPYGSLITMDDLLEAAIELNYLEKEDKKILEHWKLDPKAWSENYTQKLQLKK